LRSWREVGEDLFERGLCLPSGTRMTEEDLQRVIATIKTYHKFHLK
jgi:dTDP-4-amino-4,6-dideoxygalactose transaminase